MEYVVLITTSLLVILVKEISVRKLIIKYKIGKLYIGLNTEITTMGCHKVTFQAPFYFSHTLFADITSILVKSKKAQLLEMEINNTLGHIMK